MASLTGLKAVFFILTTSSNVRTFNPRLVKIAKYLAPIWALLGFGGALWGRKPSNKSPQTIVVFDFHLIGDIVLLTPLLKALRTRYPDAHICLVAGPWAAELLAGTNWVSHLLAFEAPWVKYGQGWRGLVRCLRLVWLLRKTPWDWGIEVRGDVRQIALLFFCRVSRRVGYNFTGGQQLLTDLVPDDAAHPHLLDHNHRIAQYLHLMPPGAPFVSQLQLSEAERLQAARIAPYIGFHFDASLPLRRLPLEEVDLLLARFLTSALPLIVFMPPRGAQLLHAHLTKHPLFLNGRLQLWRGGLRDMVVHLSRAVHFFAMDSGPAHIAASLEIPVTVFFGPAWPERVQPVGRQVSVRMRSDVPCRPCDQVHCVHPIAQYCLRGLTATIEPQIGNPQT